MPLVSRVRYLCNFYDIKMEVLAKEIIGIGENSIYRWDTNAPSIDKVAKAADYFGVSTDYLLYGFNRAAFSLILGLLKNKRTTEQFANDTEIDVNDLNEWLAGVSTKQPDDVVVEKLCKDNPVKSIVTTEDIRNHSGIEVSPSPITEDSTIQNEQETELLRIFNVLGIKDKTALLSYAYELEEKNQ
jgi:transcriptional regulator with XRE-family HTH domain